YADYLGLDSGDIVRRFREEAARIHGTTKLVFPALTSEGKVPRAAVLLVSAVGLAVVYGAWYYLSSRGSVQLPLIAEVPDRLVALPPDAGAPPLPQPSASPPAPAIGANAGSAPADASPPTSPGSAIAAPAAPSQEIVPPLAPETSPTATPSGSAGAAVPNEASANAPPESDMPATAAAGGGVPVTPRTPSDSAAPESGAATPTTGGQVTSPAAAAAPGGKASPAPVPSPPSSAASGTPAPANDTNGIPVAPAPPAAESPAPTQEAALPADAAKGVVLEARIDSWIKIVDGTGKVVFSQILRAGDHYALPDQPGLVLDTGNAGGLDVIVNGSKAPALGEVGAVRHRIVMDPARLLDGTAASN